MLIGLDASRAAIDRRTGTEAYAKFLIQALVDPALQSGHRLRLYFNNPPSQGLFPQRPGLEEVVIPFPRFWTHWRLARELAKRPPDIFFTPAHVIPYTYRGISVATVHDLGYLHFPQTHPRRQLAYLRWSTKHNARRSRLIIADSLATKQDLERFYQQPAGKIEVAYPGIDPALNPVTDPAILANVCRKYSITPPYLLFIGTLQPRKNVGRLIEAFKDSAVPEKLVLAGGKGWLADPILDQVKSLEASVRDRIRLVGYIDEADKAALISGSSALLYPSLYEGFGFPVLEGQACGTPVLASNTSSLPEIAGPGALFIDPLDTKSLAKAIKQLVSDMALRESLIQAGHRNVARFTWQSTAKRVLFVLEKAAGSPI